MYVIASSDLCGYELGTDNLVEDLNEFLSNVVMGLISPQKIVVDEEQQEVISVLEENGFDIVMLHSYLKYKEKTEESEPVQKKKPKYEPITNKEIETDEKPSFLSKLFGRKKKAQSENIQLDTNLINLVSNFCHMDERGRKVKQLCLDKGFLSVEDIKKAEKRMDDSFKYGHPKRFIQCARDSHLLTEDEAALVLSLTVNKEVVSKNECTPDRLLQYNLGMLDLLSNFFIYHVDEAKKEVTICKDCSDEPALYLLEKKFMNYHVIILNVVEGVTKEVIQELKAGANNG